MKVNFILPFKFLNGGVKVIFEYANHLTARGHEVKIYYPLIPMRFGAKWADINRVYHQVKGFLANIKQGKRVNWFDIRVKIIRIPWLSENFIEEADVVVATAWPTAYTVNKLSNTKGKKFYFIQHYETWDGPLNKIDESYRLHLNQIVIATWLKGLMKEKFNREVEGVITNGIDFSKFYNQKKVLNEKKRILMLHNQLKWKGVSDGIKAFELVRKKHPDIQLVMYGVRSSPLIPDYAEFYQKPSPAKLRELYGTSDIFISPSWSEGCQLPPMEAMACKCAVVATDVGGIPDYAIKSKTALVCQPRDIDTMAKHLIRLLDNPDELMKFSMAGYNHIKQFTWERAVSKLEHVFQKHLDQDSDGKIQSEEFVGTAIS